MILKKSFIIVLTVFVLTLVAGCYGILHDVITYKISPEYFTKFKFVQFGLITPGKDLPINTLQLLLITGWVATWWVGFIAAGIFVGVALKIHSADDVVVTAIFRASIIMMFTVIVAGLIGYNIGFFVTPPENIAQLCLQCATLKNPDAFVTAGYVHNFSYFGGVVGIIFGVISIFKYRYKVDVPVV